MPLGRTKRDAKKRILKQMDKAQKRRAAAQSK